VPDVRRRPFESRSAQAVEQAREVRRAARARRPACPSSARSEALARVSVACVLLLGAYVLGGEGAPPVFLHAHYSLQALADHLRPDLDFAVVAPGEPGLASAMAMIELVFGNLPVDVLPD